MRHNGAYEITVYASKWCVRDDSICASVHVSEEKATHPAKYNHFSRRIFPEKIRCGIFVLLGKVTEAGMHIEGRGREKRAQDRRRGGGGSSAISDNVGN